MSSTIDKPPLEGDRESPEIPIWQQRPPLLLGHPKTTLPSNVTNSLSPKRRGQKSIVQQLHIEDYDDEIALQKRQKQQERFREAQSIQREMRQIEFQFEELEKIGREIEQNLRDAEGSMLISIYLSVNHLSTCFQLIKKITSWFG